MRTPHHRTEGRLGLRRFLAAPLIVCLAAAATAQGRVWIVGPPGEPGADFEDLPPAVAAAADGDILVVRRGFYSAFTTGKGIAVLAEAGAEIVRAPTLGMAAVRVQGLPAGRTFVLRGMTLSRALITGELVVLESCAGRVLLEGVDARRSTLVPALRAVDCAQLWVQRCLAGGRPAVHLIRSHAVIGSSEATGTPAVLTPGGAALRVEGGSAILSQCVLRGGDALTTHPSTPPGPAVESFGADLTVTGDAASELRAGSHHPFPISAIAGSGGTLRLHPQTTVIPNGAAPAIEPSIPWTHVEVPSLAVGPAVLGSRIEVALYGRAGGSLVLVAALPGPRVALGSLGAWWLDPAGPMVVLSAAVPASRRFALGVAVPPVPALLGVVVAWQAAEGTPTGGFLLSNPAAYAHGL